MKINYLMLTAVVLMLLALIQSVFFRSVPFLYHLQPWLVMIIFAGMFRRDVISFLLAVICGLSLAHFSFLTVFPSVTISLLVWLTSVSLTMTIFSKHSLVSVLVVTILAVLVYNGSLALVFEWYRWRNFTQTNFYASIIGELPWNILTQLLAASAVFVILKKISKTFRLVFLTPI